MAVSIARVGVVTAVILSVLLSLVFGAHTAEWSWGPALSILAVSVIISGFIRSGGGRWNIVFFSMLPAVAWIVFRSFQSPVYDCARSDLLLLLAMTATAIAVYAVARDPRCLSLMYLGLSLVSLLNIAIAIIQSQNPEFIWPYNNKPIYGLTGFFGHYNYFANFTLGVALMLCARALFGNDRLFLRGFYLIICAISLAIVVMSGSRGGALAFGVGILILIIAAGLVAWRRNLWWSKWVLLLMPIILIGATVGGWGLVKKVNAQRTQDGGVERMFDNSARLQWIDLAIQVAKDHPISGGGSRSYSWERNAHWDTREFGPGTENERFVHNELIQAITDYGLVGAVLVIIPIFITGGLAITALVLADKNDNANTDPVAAGVMAAGAGILVQANFSFVFHLLPSTLLLGALLGLGALLHRKNSNNKSSIIPICASAIIAAPLCYFGIQGSRVLYLVWPVIYGEQYLAATQPEEAIDRLSKACQIWPGHRLWQIKGDQALIGASKTDSENLRRNLNAEAISSYQEAARFHPYEPGLALNMGNAYINLGKYDEAAHWLRKAVELQGGLEAAYKARYYLGICYYEHGYDEWTNSQKRRPEFALWYFLRAQTTMEEAIRQASHKRDPDYDVLLDRINKSIAILKAGKVLPVAPDSAIND